MIAFWHQQDELSTVINTIKALLQKHQQRVRNREFLEAAMGASALLATADGEVSFAELMARDYLLDRVEILHMFDSGMASDLFRQYAESIQEDSDAGAATVFESVKKLSGDEELALLLIRVCIAICKADLTFSEREHAIVADLCQVLGLEGIDLDSQTEFE